MALCYARVNFCSSPSENMALDDDKTVVSCYAMSTGYADSSDHIRQINGCV